MVIIWFQLIAFQSYIHNMHFSASTDEQNDLITAGKKNIVADFVFKEVYELYCGKGAKING